MQECVGWVWVLMENMDKCEGRGPLVPVAAFTTEHIARGIESLNKQQYSVKKMELYRTAEDWHVVRQEKLKKEGLAKLTPDEKRALGL